MRRCSSRWKDRTQPGSSSSWWSPAWSHVAVGWHVLPVMESLPHTVILLPSKSGYSINATLPSIVRRMWTHHWTCPSSTCSVQLSMLLTPAQTSLTVNGSHCWPLATLWAQRFAVCSLFLIIWTQSRLPKHPGNPACKPLEESLRFLRHVRVKKRSSWGVVFLACSLCGLSLTSPVLQKCSYDLFRTMLQPAFEKLHLQPALREVLPHRC